MISLFYLNYSQPNSCLVTRKIKCRHVPHKPINQLDHIIKPAVTSGLGSSFEDLLEVMEDCEYYDDVKSWLKW